MPPSDNETLIACAGSHVDWVCADAIDRITRAGSHPDWRFVLHSWLDGDYSEVSLAWVTDSAFTVEEVYPFLRARLALLVPESNAPLLQLCKAATCGLYYKTPEDTIACLERLIEDATLRTALGENGFLHTVQQ